MLNFLVDWRCVSSPLFHNVATLSSTLNVMIDLSIANPPKLQLLIADFNHAMVSGVVCFT